MSFNYSFDRPIQNILIEFRQYHHEIKYYLFINNPEKIYNLQRELYGLIHKTCRSHNDTLSFEFILGLARFDIALQLILKFVADNECYKNNITPKRFIEINKIFSTSRDATFFDRLGQIAKVGEELINAIITATKDSNDRNYWETVTEYFKKNDSIRLLSTQLVSMQFIPNNSSFLSIAQILHWNGLGGNARIFEPYAALKPVTDHAIQYHGIEQKQNFKERMSIFNNAREYIMNYVTHVVTNAIPFFGTDCIRIYDICSGPRFAACEKIFSALPNYEFQLSVSDIDGGSLANLINIKENKKAPTNVIIEHIYYEDMNLSLSQEKHKPYHLIMAGLGLHQIAKDSIPKVLKNLSLRLQHRGLLVNPDVGNNAASQLFLIPANIVDREGSVDDYNLFNLRDLINNEENSALARVLYPLHRVCSSHSNKSGPYMVNIFIALDFPKVEIQQLCTKWNNNKEDCDVFISALAKTDIVNLQTAMTQTNQLNNISSLHP